ncbi:hypothetical protein BLOT_009997 [Blomia tropicalis]|nr:hypothetical protein BLOT_009997 [Blomia tropicalis]
MSLKRNANLAFWLVLPRSFFSPTVSPLTSCEGTSSMSLSTQASQNINTYININNNRIKPKKPTTAFFRYFIDQRWPNGGSRAACGSLKDYLWLSINALSSLYNESSIPEITKRLFEGSVNQKQLLYERGTNSQSTYILNTMLFHCSRL